MIRITVWIQGLLSEFVTIGRYGKWLTLILIRQMAALVRRALAEVRAVPVLLVLTDIIAHLILLLYHLLVNKRLS